MTTLSLCMIVKNEAKNLDRCLSSVQGVADEIVVVDTGSTDRTVAIAQEHGARLFHHPWHNDFAEARNVGLEQARCDWILHLDADEELEADSRGRLKKALEQVGPEGLLMVVRSLLPPGPGTVHDDVLQVRLFRNRPAYRYVSQVHEQIMTSIMNAGGKFLMTDLQIVHYGYLKPVVQTDNSRDQRNLALLEQALALEPQNSYLCAKLGLQYYLAGMEALAEVYLLRVLSLDYHTLPVYQFQDVLLTLGYIAFKREDDEAALHWASDCLRLLNRGNRAWAAMVLSSDAHLRSVDRALTALTGRTSGAAEPGIGPADVTQAHRHLEQAESQLELVLEQAELNEAGASGARVRLEASAELRTALAKLEAAQPSRPTAAARLEALLAADDLAEALRERPDWLDDDLLSLVQSNARAARHDGQVDLAEGLDALAESVAAELAGRQSG